MARQRQTESDSQTGVFGRLLGAVTLSQLGNGVHAVAFPLLGASLTDDARLIAALATVGMLPGLLLAIPAGALVDRFDRGRLLVVVDLGRVAVVVLLVAGIAGGAVEFWHVLFAAFLLGFAELLFDSAMVAFVPSLVPPAGLPAANGRLRTVSELGNGIVGPPLGGALFGVAAAMPFLLNGVSALGAAALIAWIAWRRPTRPRGPAEPADAPSEQPHSAGGSAEDAHSAAPGAAAEGAGSEDVEEEDTKQAALAGLKWMLGHRRMAVLALTVGGWNLFGWMPEAVLVLYAQEELGVGALGFSLLFMTTSVGAALGGLVSGRLIDRLGMSGVMQATLWSFAVFAFPPAFLNAPVLVGAVFLAQGTFIVGWVAVTTTIRQTLVPDHMLGRVGSAFYLMSGALGPLGLMLGGVVAEALGLRSIFVVSGVGLTVLALVTAKPLRELAADAEAALQAED